ncbi:MAG: hypothetical protein ACLVL7_00440 [Anaerotruncus massiliensis (ex Togo et al. 2019)]
MNRHNRIDLSGRRGGNSLPLCLLLALAPALIGCFPAVSYPLEQQMKRAFLVWPALCWQFFSMLAVAAYLTAAAILCARAFLRRLRGRRGRACAPVGPRAHGRRSSGRRPYPAARHAVRAAAGRHRFSARSSWPFICSRAGCATDRGRG